MEAVYYAARANLRRHMRLHPRLLAPAVCPSGGHVARVGQAMQAASPGGRASRRAGAAQSLTGAEASARKLDASPTGCLTCKSRRSAPRQ